MELVKLVGSVIHCTLDGGSSGFASVCVCIPVCVFVCEVL